MNSRSLAVIAALAVAPAAALAQEAAPAQGTQRDLAGDVDKVAAKADATAERLAEVEASVKSLKKLRFSGYVQARYAEGEKAVYGTRSSIDKEGFYIRRGRFKAVYDAGNARAGIQLDATASGVSLKEAFATVKLPMGFSVDAGQILLPFGYEVGVTSSSRLDVLERSAAIRKLLAGEYDRGVQVNWHRGGLQAKLGVFNGNGVDGGAYDNDRAKDVVGRVSYDFGVATVGASGWLGTLRVYDDAVSGSTTLPAGDFDRTRIGLDAQAFLDLLPIGGTALKGEFIQGQTILGKSLTDADLVALKAEVPQLGWYLLVNQAIGKDDAVAIRYDFYDEDTDKTDGEAGAKATGTLAVAYHHCFGGNFKASVLYELPRQVKGPSGFKDPKDDALTVQLQASF